MGLIQPRAYIRTQHDNAAYILRVDLLACATAGVFNTDLVTTRADLVNGPPSFREVVDSLMISEDDRCSD